MKLFLQKNAKFSSAGGSAPRPPCLRRLGALPPNPQPPAAGGFAPRPPLASGGWGLRPQTPQTAPPIANFWLRACSQRIEKALGRLRQRYGVSGGLTSEPKIIAIRNGSKVAFNASSMKMYNEDLNTLEVYAFAHDEVDKLSGQLLIDTASRLPNLLKRRYLDYLD